ncbi:unnamed protein product, partial [Discosporangium mesarthrocarpum]
MNGRVLDTWRRLNAPNHSFFVPHDLELSIAEVRHACEGARTWQGPGGARRLVEVHKYNAVEDPRTAPRSWSSKGRGGGWGGASGSGSGDQHKGGKQPQGDVEQTTHVAIFQVGKGGKHRALFRRFVQEPDGSILEVSKGQGPLGI